MAGHIAQCAGTEVPPAAEVPRSVNRIVGTVGCRADKGIPVHRLGNALVVLGTAQTLRPDRTVGEGFDFAHLADFAVPDPLANLADAFVRCTLVTHLGRNLVFVSQFRQQAGLVNGVGQRFLDIDVLAGSHRIGCDNRVRMVGGSHHHGVGRFEHLVEHLTVVVVLFGSGVTLEDMVGVFPVDVAQADDVLAFQPFQHRGTASADTHAQDVELIAGRRITELLT